MTAPAGLPDPRRIWLVPFLNVMSRSEREVRKLLRDAATAAAKDVAGLTGDNIGARVRRGQLRAAQAELLRTLSGMWRAVGKNIEANRIDAAVSALDASVRWDQRLYRAMGLSTAEIQVIRDGAMAVSERNVQLMVRRFTTQQIPLSRQVYKTQALTKGWVDSLVNRAIGKGLTAREFAQEVRRFVSPLTPGGASFAAMRLARTELNNAYHAAAIAASIDKPWVESVKWNLSGSHPRPDECDTLAKDNGHDLGAGCFPPNDVPPKPHPQCLCYIVPVQTDEEEFVAAFQRGDYDRYLDRAFAA